MIKYRIGNVTTHVTTSNFPGGEVKVDINVGSKPVDYAKERVWISASLKTSDDIIALILATDALRRHYPHADLHLNMPYMPYARQDRPCVDGEALSVAVMANLINMCGFTTVELIDSHSDVAPALIRNCYNYPQSVLFEKIVDSFTDYYIVAPDAGAYKKAHNLAKSLNAKGVICANKVRNVKTGRIENVLITEDVSGLNLLVADDICDGGRTFIELGQLLRDKGCAALKLVVTHGLFTHGIDVVADKFDMIYSTNSYLSEPLAHSKVRWINVV